MIWTRRISIFLIVFAFLYVFGDFRINDVNVRDFLQSHISPKNVIVIKDEAVKAWGSVYQMIESTFKADYSRKKQVDLSRTRKPQDKLTPQDKKQMLKLLRKNLEFDESIDEKKASSKVSNYLQ